MNINEEYLWDKTGEPDPEIQQLEEILGTLRYQPKALEIPAGIRVGRERSFFRDYGPRLAIAATITMLLLGAGLWFGLQRLQRGQHEIVKAPQTPAPIAEQPSVPVPSPNLSPSIATALDNKPREAPPRHRVNQSALANNSNRLHKETVTDAELAKNQPEGEAAKDQLMLALRLASTKLSFAQRKMQITNSRDQIHNQHKIG